MNKKGIDKRNVNELNYDELFIKATLQASVKRSKIGSMNKRGMIGNIIGAFIAILVGFSILGMVSQEIDNVINCNGTYNITYEEPLGSTDSFGGGGSGQFGGYDGEVHKSWSSNLAPFKTNESLLNQDCEQIGGINKSLLEHTPIIFSIVIFILAFSFIYNSFRKSGFL